MSGKANSCGAGFSPSPNLFEPGGDRFVWVEAVAASIKTKCWNGSPIPHCPAHPSHSQHPLPDPSSACFSEKGGGKSHPCWILIEGLSASCTLGTLCKTVPPLWKYWFCSDAKISELAINQNSLCKPNLPSDRFSQHEILVRKWSQCLCACLLCSLLVTSSHWGRSHEAVVLRQSWVIMTQRRAGEFFLQQAGWDDNSLHTGVSLENIVKPKIKRKSVLVAEGDPLFALEPLVFRFWGSH